MSTAVDEYEGKYGKENVILLDNGDLYQGTPISSYNISQYTQGKTKDINPMALALEQIGFDAAILGNHEFNYPWATMSDIYAHLKSNGVGVVCANMYYSATGQRVFDPYLLKEIDVNGKKVTIGIIGLENTDCTRWDVEDNYPGMIFASPENTSMDLAYEVQKVQNEWKAANIKPDFVMVCYHGALGTESGTLTFGANTENQVLRIIRNTTGIDMVISGHDHSTSYSNNQYQNKDGKNVLVVNGGGTELTASVWNIAFDEEGNSEISLNTLEDGTSIDSKNLKLSNYPTDASLKAQIKPYADAAENYVKAPVGNLKGWDGKKNTGNRYYLEQTDTVDLINRAQIAQGSKYLNEKYTSIDSLNAKLKEIYGEGAKQLTADALQDGKLIVDMSSTSIVTSNPLPAEGDSELTMKGIYGFYKYDNSLYLLALTGREIKDLVEYNASERILAQFKNGEVHITDTGDYNANFTFPVCYGLNYTIDMAKEKGNRVEITGFANGKAFDEKKVYLVGINNYHLGNVANTELAKYTTKDSLWSQTDDLGGGYAQDLIADYVSDMTEQYGGVYNSAQADKNGEGICKWNIAYSGEIPTETVISDNAAYAGERVTELKSGDQVILCNVANEATISEEYKDETAPTLAAASGTAKEKVMYGETGTAVFTVDVTAEGYYTFRAEKGYLTSKATGSGLGYQEALNEYGLWELVKTEEEGVFHLKNVNARYNGTSAQYLEYYYGKFTTYGMNTSSADAYKTSFYKIQTSGREVAAEKLQDGDQLLIYYNSGSTVLGGVNGTKLAAVPARPVSTQSGKTFVTPEDGAAIFQVGVREDGSYTFATADGYLTCEKGLTYKSEISADSCWKLESTEDGHYFIRNAGAADQYLEYYNGFTTYTKKNTSDASLYTFTLCKIGAAAKSDEEEIGGYVLPVFETSDVHGYLLDTSSGNEETYQYRLAYIANEVNDARNTYGEDNVVLLDGGDIYQGNVISNLQDGQPMTAAYDLMSYDAVTIGNHEFDWGYETVIDQDGTMGAYSVGDYEGNSEVPVIASNIYQDDEKITFAKDYVILEKTATDKEGNKIDVKVGVIGFVDDYAADIMGAKFTGIGFKVQEDYDALEELANKLETEQDCDATIVLCHADAAVVAGSLKKDSVIDLVCGGHSHSAQSGSAGNGMSYVQPSSQAASYGYAELVFQSDESSRSGAGSVSKVDTLSKKTVSVTGDKTKLYDTEENADVLDEAMVDLAKASVADISDVLNETLGFVTTGITKKDLGEDSSSSTAGNWVTSLMARSVGAQVAFTNNGGIRTEFPLEEGAETRNITSGDVYSILPFCNAIYGYELTYPELLEVLQYSLGSGAALKLRMSGIDCYYTDGLIHTLVLPDGTVVDKDGNWNDGYDAKTIKVAVNEYVATSDTPFRKWNDTEKLLDHTVIDNEGAILALKKEAEKSKGYLHVDGQKHMIRGSYVEKAHEHAYTFTKVFAPTCLEQGYTMYICEECGEYYFADYTEKAEHTLITGKTVAPTCTEDGYTVYTCEVCNYTYHGDVTAATGHTYKDGVCSICGEKESENPGQKPEQKPGENKPGQDDNSDKNNGSDQNNGADQDNGADKNNGAGQNNGSNTNNTPAGNNNSGNPTNKTAAANTGDAAAETALYFMLSMAGAGMVLCLSFRQRRRKNNH